jgi:hypothetical protein
MKSNFFCEMFSCDFVKGILQKALRHEKRIVKLKFSPELFWKLLTLEKKALGSSKTSEATQSTTQRRIPERDFSETPR